MHVKLNTNVELITSLGMHQGTLILIPRHPSGYADIDCKHVKHSTNVDFLGSVGNFPSILIASKHVTHNTEVEFVASLCILQGTLISPESM